MEILHKNTARTPVRAVLFDFDGTISTLRCGWEAVMKPLMLEMISGGRPWDAALEKEVEDYISDSTGIQTIHQMKWLAAAVQERGNNPDAPTDPWWYKGEYNRRLMENVSKRVESLTTGTAPNTEYLIAGSEEFLRALCEHGVKLYVASGTDHPDVCAEAAALGLDGYFTLIAGAPVGEENCSKEKVMARLLQAEGLHGDEVAVIGDGKVEIRLGYEAGARTVGLATDERAGGVDAVKRERLIRAGADIIAGDFLEKDALLAFLGL
ncbi:MAG: HAD family hydrolase [Oscillospiraceae bacterium]|nr:HAD family hydrolase [Oscillospiraceae bacterium]